MEMQKITQETISFPKSRIEILQKGVKYDQRKQQGGFNKKKIQLNLCNIFSILIFNELYLFA